MHHFPITGRINCKYSRPHWNDHLITPEELWSTSPRIMKAISLKFAGECQTSDFGSAHSSLLNKQPRWEYITFCDVSCMNLIKQQHRLLLTGCPPICFRVHYVLPGKPIKKTVLFRSSCSIPLKEKAFWKPAPALLNWNATNQSSKFISFQLKAAILADQPCP